MRKIAKSKIIGFEIRYDDMDGFFKASAVLEVDDVLERSCTSVYVPYDGPAREVYWKYDCGSMDLIGVELDACNNCRECEEYKKIHEKHGIVDA